MCTLIFYTQKGKQIAFKCFTSEDKSEGLTVLYEIVD